MDKNYFIFVAENKKYISRKGCLKNPEQAILNSKLKNMFLFNNAPTNLNNIFNTYRQKKKNILKMSI